MYKYDSVWGKGGKILPPHQTNSTGAVFSVDGLLLDYPKKQPHAVDSATLSAVTFAWLIQLKILAIIFLVRQNIYIPEKLILEGIQENWFRSIYIYIYIYIAWRFVLFRFYMYLLFYIYIFPCKTSVLPYKMKELDIYIYSLVS